jgi:hypothetical protein
MRVSRKRLIGLKEDMNSLLMLLLGLQTLSQRLCMKQGRGKQLRINNNYKHQNILKVHLLEFKRAVAKMVNVQGREEVETRVTSEEFFWFLRAAQQVCP